MARIDHLRMDLDGLFHYPHGDTDRVVSVLLVIVPAGAGLAVVVMMIAGGIGILYKCLCK